MNRKLLVSITGILCATCIGLAASAASATAATAHPTAPTGSLTASARLVHDNRQMTCADDLCNFVSANNNAVGVVDFKQSLASVSTVCVTFGFQGDLLDPGEAVNIQFDSTLDPMSVANSGATGLSLKTTCVDSLSRPDITTWFVNNGPKLKFSVFSAHGSEWLKSLDVSVTR